MCGIVEHSSTGKLLVTGADRLDLLHRLSTNDLLKLQPLSAVGTVFTTDKGRIVDYARVLVLSDSLLLITSAQSEDKLQAWIEKYILMEDVQIENVTPRWTMFSIVGPEAPTKYAANFGHMLEPDRVTEQRIASATVMVDYQQEGATVSLNVLVPSENAPSVWNELKGQGEAVGFPTMSNQAYECFRIFHGIPMSAKELTGDFNPYEVGLGHAISYTKGCYIGQEVIARLDTYKKIQRKLVRLTFNELRSDIPLRARFFKADSDVGLLTSVAPVPIDGESLALGVVDQEKVIKGDSLSLVHQSYRTKGIVTGVFNWKRS